MLNLNAKEFKPLHSVTDSSGSDSDSICDELNNLDEKNILIQKQIEEDLATHDFSKPHVTREEIQEIINFIIQ